MKIYAKLALVLVVVALLSASTFFIYDYGRNECVVAQQQETIKQVEAARKEEQAKQEAINDSLQELLDKKNVINSKLVDDIKRLQHRISRGHMSEAAKANCKGASGTELSREHAEFLTRYAAIAAEQDAALTACYKYADTVASD